ncbi:CBS domain-containing protein [Streptomyces sp. WMMC500]|uniref:CBS domain-containing protein n=1 Tax=Streptomyces sp. WMMC500 TaxID=3015154 RepID=UPI00248B0A77|nr:CBS domain-containing protein [Streptomyces sp. WMMC500]WBB61948.1 CBS domain-containing protein [Streptomyces sp. WMMC500]
MSAPTGSEGTYQVSDVMTHTVVAVGCDAPFKEIVAILQQWKVSALPVLAGDGRVIGVVSEADLLPKEEFRDSDPTRFEQLRRLEDLAKAGAVTARELMSTPAVTVHADATLAEAARIMAVRHVKRLPVADAEGKLAGVVSRADLLKVFLRSDEELAAAVRDEVLAHLFLGYPPQVEALVHEGVVTLTGQLDDRTRVPVLARLVRAVEGVVDVRMDLAAPPPRPQRATRPDGANAR